MFMDELVLVTFKDWLAEEIEKRDGRWIRDVETGVILKLLRSEPYGEALAVVKRYLCAEIAKDFYGVNHQNAEILLTKLASIEADIALYDWDSDPEEPLPFQDPDDQEPEEDPEGDEEDEAAEVD